ncbi:MAG: hypothetical protein AAGF25_13010 [Pseudomonadota bacterium]
MAYADTNPVGGFWGTLFATPEERAEQQKQKALARKKQEDEDLQVAKDLRDSGYFDQNQNAYYQRYYYFHL